jgi:3-oxoacyl-[acyl-carrier protein] reductase
MIDNELAVITGGCGQIGYATAKMFASQGLTVVSLVRRDLEEAERMMGELPNQELNHKAILASVTDTASIKSAVKYIDDTFGRCDVLVNAAGTNKVHPVSHIDSFTDEIFDSIIATNLKGTFVCCREFLPLLKRESGLIVNLSSVSAYTSNNKNVAYGASKAGIDLLTKTLAKGLGPKVRVVGIAPGFLENATSGIVKPQGFNEKVIPEIPLGRVATGDDIADIIKALMNTMTYVNGVTIKVDGGRDS